MVRSEMFGGMRCVWRTANSSKVWRIPQLSRYHSCRSMVSDEGKMVLAEASVTDRGAGDGVEGRVTGGRWVAAGC